MFYIVLHSFILRLTSEICRIWTQSWNGLAAADTSCFRPLCNRCSVTVVATQQFRSSSDSSINGLAKASQGLLGLDIKYQSSRSSIDSNYLNNRRLEYIRIGYLDLSSMLCRRFKMISRSLRSPYWLYEDDEEWWYDNNRWPGLTSPVANANQSLQHTSSV